MLNRTSRSTAPASIVRQNQGYVGCTEPTVLLLPRLLQILLPDADSRLIRGRRSAIARSTTVLRPPSHSFCHRRFVQFGPERLELTREVVTLHLFRDPLSAT